MHIHLYAVLLVLLDVAGLRLLPCCCCLLHADALALAGCDYLVLTAKVMADLENSPTLQGYNTGGVM